MDKNNTALIKFSPDQIIQKITSKEINFVNVMQDKKFTVEFYNPVEKDLQKPHTRDEIYVIVEGEGEFECGESKGDFKAGDLIFVPKNTFHRFLNFGRSLKTWVIFFN